MKLSKDYIIGRLQHTSVEQLARELAEAAAKQYSGVDMAATVTKFEAMLRPLAPKEMKATDFMRAQGVHVTEVA